MPGDKAAVTALAISGAFVFGLVLALLGSLKLALARRADLGEGRVGVLLLTLNVALIPMMLLAGVLLDAWGVRAVLILGSLLLTLALLGLSARPAYGRALLAVLAAGLGASALSAASVVLMPSAFFGVPETVASLNVGTVFIALGALVTPVLTDVLLGWVGLRRTLALLAFVCLVPAFVAALPARWELSAPRPAGAAELFGTPDVWLAGLVFFFYAPLEAAVSLWATTYLARLGYGERRATWLLAGFWGAFLASRLLVGLAQHAGHLRDPDAWGPWLLVIPALLAAVVLGNLAGATSPRSARVGLLLLGLFLGPIFPTLLGMVFRTPGLHEAQGTAYGVLFAVGSVGTLVLAPLIGAGVRRGTPQTALRLPMLLALVLTATGLLFSLVTGR
jgi:fucose permease